jgi:hypothetical protein
MISTEPVTFEEAWAFAREKQLLPTSLTSAELSAIHAQLKQRAVFSAQMTLAGFLDTLQKNLELIASGNEDEHGRIRSIPEAKAQLLKTLDRLGYMPKPGEEGTLLDHASDARLQLIVETNVLDTLGAGRYEAGTDEQALDINPGWRLVRMVQSRVQRDWAKRWDDAGASVNWKGASQSEMVALKNSPIWQALGNGAGGYRDTLGNPWAPFAFKSGMNTISAPRAECEALGLLTPGQRLTPPPKRDLNETLQASAGQFSAELQHALASNPDLRMEGGVLTLARNEAAVNAKAMVAALLELTEEAA